MRRTVGALALALGACATAAQDTTTTTGGPPPPPAAAEQETTTTEQATTTTVPEVAIEDRFELALSTPISWEDSGLSLEASTIVFRVLDTEAPEFRDAVEFELIDPDAQTSVGFIATVTNATGRDVDWFPDQGTLQIGPHQEDANIFIAERQIGGTLLDGTTREGDIVWVFSVPAADLMAIGEARYVAMPAFESESFTDATGELNVTFTWEPPSV